MLFICFFLVVLPCYFYCSVIMRFFVRRPMRFLFVCCVISLIINVSDSFCLFSFSPIIFLLMFFDCFVMCYENDADYAESW